MPLLRRSTVALCVWLSAGWSGAALATDESAVDLWASYLRPQFFGERAIRTGQDVVELRIPRRAEDSGVVPISINARIAQTPQRYIRTLYVIVDKNPKPLAGKFTLTPAMGRADLALRLRINEFTYVRVIAETNDGELYMDSGYTRASGGCSEPPPFLALKEARARIGQMRLRASAADDARTDDVALAHLLVSHPNVTGLQLDQRTRAFIPAEYVTEVVVHFNGEHVLTAETDISISEDPSFRFFFKPAAGGTLSAAMFDSKGRHFTREFAVDANLAVIERPLPAD